ncbi:MAG: hypothetical protein AAB403_19870, partial [Planctomycetota bacterium]
SGKQKESPFFEVARIQNKQETQESLLRNHFHQTSSALPAIKPDKKCALFHHGATFVVTSSFCQRDQ